jgi:phosphomevalonate kinase
MIEVSVPGKAMLCGEYAVLAGAPAIATAVDRFVHARISAPGAPDTPFVAAARAAVKEFVGDAAAPLAIDSSELHHGGRKLGLGSSAAVTVAAAGVLLAGAGHSLAPAALLAVAREAHGRAQGGRGSGVDVAVACFGGTVRCVSSGGALEVRPTSLPVGLALTFVATGESASTPALLARVAALAAADPALHESLLDRLAADAEAFAGALDRGDPHAAVAAADAYGRGMAALGRAAGTPIVTDELAALASLARRHGGAGKPSGAGGGDIGVAFTIGEMATDALRAELVAAGLTVLALGVGAPGPAVRTAGGPQ